MPEQGIKKQEPRAIHSENTQYGLKNKLNIAAIKALSQNYIQLSLDSQNTNKQRLYLNIQFLDSDICRFHYSFSDQYKVNSNEQLKIHDFIFKKKNCITKFMVNGQECTTQDIKSIRKINQIEMTSLDLRIEINSTPLSISVFDQQDTLISKDVAELGFWSEEFNYKNGSEFKTEIRCYKEYESLKQPPHIYGLGDKTGELDRFGRRFINNPIDALGYDSEHTDPLYKDIPFFIHFEPSTQKAHGIFFDNKEEKFFDFGRERKPCPYYHFGAKAGELDYYFIYGPSIQKVSTDYQRLTGMPALLPEFTLAYLASGMSYKENYHFKKLKEQNSNCQKNLIENFLEFIDQGSKARGFHLSSGYVENSENKRHQFIWNKEKFPEPKKFSEKANILNIELCANVKPVLLCDHPWYSEALNKKLFLNNTEGEVLVVDYWGGAGSYLDFSNISTQKWWKSKLKENIFANGILGIWNDNNEYEIFEPFDGQARSMAYLMCKLSHEAYFENQAQELKIPKFENLITEKKSKQLQKVKRPWILTRSGYSGIQEYAQTWTGDNYSNFKALKYDQAILSSMGLSGLTHSGSDIGGFWGDSPDPELLKRWIQVGVFNPRFSIHSYKEEATHASMYANKDYQGFKTIQKYLKLRDELLPYIYQANYKAHTEGIAIQRPIVTDFQFDICTHSESTDFLFGDSMLVAPIFEHNSQERRVYLPDFSLATKDEIASKSWIHLFNHEEFHGGQEITDKLKEDNIPVFVRSNTVIPSYKYQNEITRDPDLKDLEFNIYLDKDFYRLHKSFEYELYQDDGFSMSYLADDYLKTKFMIKACKDHKLEITVISQEGNYENPFKGITANIVHQGNVAKQKIDFQKKP